MIVMIFSFLMVILFYLYRFLLKKTDIKVKGLFPQ